MFKKYLILFFLAVFLLFLMSSCGSNTADTSPSIAMDDYLRTDRIADVGDEYSTYPATTAKTKETTVTTSVTTVIPQLITSAPANKAQPTTKKTAATKKAAATKKRVQPTKKRASTIKKQTYQTAPPQNRPKTTVNNKRGDVNRDGVVDIHDVKLLGSLLSSGASMTRYMDGADVDGNGRVDMNDLPALLKLVSSGG